MKTMRNQRKNSETVVKTLDFAFHLWYSITRADRNGLFKFRLFYDFLQQEQRIA